MCTWSRSFSYLEKPRYVECVHGAEISPVWKTELCRMRILSSSVSNVGKPRYVECVLYAQIPLIGRVLNLLLCEAKFVDRHFLLKRAQIASLSNCAVSTLCVTTALHESALFMSTPIQKARKIWPVLRETELCVHSPGDCQAKKPEG